MKNKLTIGEFLLQSIKKAGIKSIFGIPGDMVIRFFKVIEDDRDLKLYTFSHEPGVGFAAVASARASRKPAVACVTYGVGGLNMLNAVACAYAEKTPLIVLSGGPGEDERAKDSFLHHTVKDFDSQLKIFREVTCEAVILDSQKTARARRETKCISHNSLANRNMRHYCCCCVSCRISPNQVETRISKTTNSHRPSANLQQLLPIS